MYSLGCKSIKIGPALFIVCYMHFTWSGVLTMPGKDLLKHNNPINTCLINLKIILYYS